MKLNIYIYNDDDVVKGLDDGYDIRSTLDRTMWFN